MTVMKKIKKRQSGFTLVEVLIVTVIAAIPVIVVGTLLVGGQDSFTETYNAVHKDIQQDALVTMTAFGSVGRKSNKTNYKVYTVQTGAFTEAQPPKYKTIAKGQAVEFRYWQDTYEPGQDDLDILDTTNTGDRYALFYLDGRDLKVDYGEVVNGVGAVSGGKRNQSDIRTQVLAHNVDIASNDEIFSHTVIAGSGQGSVRMDLMLKDDEGEQVHVKTSVLLRVVWPR